jgi:hypothetical protein
LREEALSLRPFVLAIGAIGGLVLGRGELLWGGMITAFALACVAVVLGSYAWGRKDMRLSPIGVLAAVVVGVFLLGVVAIALAWRNWTF